MDHKLKVILHVCFILPRFLLQCLQNELAKHLPTFLIDPEQHGPLPAGIGKHSLVALQLILKQYVSNYTV